MAMLFAVDFTRLLEHKHAPVVGWVSLLAILVAVGFYLIGKFRGTYRESDQGSTNLLTNFRELHSQGELSDEEYRNIKAKLATRIREQFNQSEEIEFKDS
ncbi:MAG: hypothetical protein JNL96_05825 [Planctomycetaceae bacterium]|nr:hypothetical protein [Planctomycetaceae bacterium]